MGQNYVTICYSDVGMSGTQIRVYAYAHSSVKYVHVREKVR